MFQKGVGVNLEQGTTFYKVFAAVKYSGEGRMKALNGLKQSRG